jgi:hypothetical protein
MKTMAISEEQVFEIRSTKSREDLHNISISSALIKYTERKKSENIFWNLQILVG